MVHHARMGSDDDPDVISDEQFDLGSRTGLSSSQLARSVVRRLPAYNRSWYTAFGTSAVTLALSGTWCTVVVGAVALAGSAQLALATWAHMLVAFGLGLPVIRTLGEAGEHRFIAGGTAFNATISNLGWAHRWIAELDRDNFAANIQWRKKVLENVRTELDA